jgi:membrane fusion protein (multidrug efflux system)
LKLLEESSERQKKLLDMNGVSKEEYDAMMNQVSAVAADIDFVKAQISKTEIRAPFSGQVGLRFVSEGSTVSVGERIASVQQINPVKIDFSIPEKYAGSVKNGDEIRFTVEGNSEDFTGVIYAAEPKVDPATRTFRLRAISENPDGKIFPGAFARIELVLNKKESALMVPTQAIIPILKGKKVFTTENGKVVSKEVTTGTRTDELIEITSGINAGDTIITTGVMQLRDSMPVKVVVTQ